MEARAEYDLIIAGGGPAGSACAITAARSEARVLLLEKDVLPRQKVCGEFVSAESLGLLATLLGKNEFPEQPQISAARIFLNSKTISLPVSPSARSIPRFDLDKALLDSARSAGVSVAENVTVQKVEQGAPALFCVETKSKVFTGRAVVNATGRWSQLTGERPEDTTRWIGVKAHFREHAPPPSVDLYFFEGGYCGVQPVADNAVNAAAMVRADAATSMEQVLAAHPELWRRSRSWEQLFPTITTSPLYFRAPLTEDRGVMLAGDAAAFIDPFAGDGISLALQSGRLAADSLAGMWQQSLPLDEAHLRYRTEYHRRFVPAFRNAARLRAFLSFPPWIKSGVLALLEHRPVAEFVVRRTRALGY